MNEKIKVGIKKNYNLLINIAYKFQSQLYEINNRKPQTQV